MAGREQILNEIDEESSKQTLTAQDKFVYKVQRGRVRRRLLVWMTPEGGIKKA